MASKRKPHSEKTKKKISEALKKRSLGRHVEKGAKIGGGIGAVSNGLYGAVAGGITAGPIGALIGGTAAGAGGGLGGALSGSAYGAGTYGVRRGLDKLRNNKRYTYDYSSGAVEVTLEFGRGRDRKKRKTRSFGARVGRAAAVVAGGAVGGAGLLAATKGRRGRFASQMQENLAKDVGNYKKKLVDEGLVKINRKKISPSAKARINKMANSETDAFKSQGQKVVDAINKNKGIRTRNIGVLGGAASAAVLTRPKREKRGRR